MQFKVERKDTEESDEETSGLVMPETEDSIRASELDSIIDRLINYDNYPDRTISENKAQNDQTPYILKEKEIRQLISTSIRVF